MKTERNIEEILRPPFMLTHQLFSIHKKKKIEQAGPGGPKKYVTRPAR